ncbi:DNA adenine methylase [Bacillus velezensis]|uniref:DNA adenine methylase n=1 Tax=Bacillus velezensis TaxID=492670 RepID=UPI00285DBD33|nr:DNA adenine methylase [Bacillus velezensis]MDR7908842.1 DNA adenine methylase [Bacillus velezensis]
MNPSPFRYPGGKYKLYSFVKELIQVNNCSTYIEPFGGGSAISLGLLFDKSVKKVIINDYDYSIYILWYCILYKTDDLINLILEKPITIDEWYIQKSIRENVENHDPLKIAYSTLFLNRTNRSGIIDKAGPIGGYDQSGTYKIDCRFNKEQVIKKIIRISQYKNRIRLTNYDAMDFIDEVILGTRNSFTFFDPPYYKKGQRLYTNFYNHGDHVNLSKAIKQTLKNRKWIVTYDTAAEIKKMYSNMPYVRFNLSYTLQSKRSGSEFMFFSKKIKRLEEENKFINFDSKEE